MKFEMRRPCAHCPFRSDRPGYLRPGRPDQIARDLYHRDLTFACHETLDGDRLQHCAGALILHERLGRPNWRIRFAHALGIYDPARLDMAAPVAASIEEFIRVSTEVPGPILREY